MYQQYFGTNNTIGSKVAVQKVPNVENIKTS